LQRTVAACPRPATISATTTQSRPSMSTIGGCRPTYRSRTQLSTTKTRMRYYKSEHSLSQLWLVGHGPEPGQGMPADLQTIEIGWEETYSQQWAGLPPYLFISASWERLRRHVFRRRVCERGTSPMDKDRPVYTYGTTISVAPIHLSESGPSQPRCVSQSMATGRTELVRVYNQFVVGYFTFSSGPLSAN